MEESETGVLDLSEILAATKQVSRAACFVVLSGSEAGRMYTLADDLCVIGRTQEAAIRIVGDGVSRRHAQITRLPTGQVILVDLGSRNGTYCNGDRIHERILQDGDKIQVGGTTILKFSYQDAIEQDFMQRQYESVTRDALTGCHNRKSFDERLPTELAFALRHKRPMSLVMLDIDHFKTINDTYGHPGGDAVLSQMGMLLREVTREEDIVCRYGGEEFAIILREEARDGAYLVAERLRFAIDERPFSFEGTIIPVTASLGVATWDGGSPPRPQELLKSADTALYQAKQQGRNRVISAPLV